MYNKKLYFAFIAFALISCNVVDGKKSKKNKRPKEKEEQTTLQPNVVAYSTFGFNDVGAYDGFVPTSPDYASFLSGGNQDSTTRLYAPAFPSAADSTGYGSNFGSSSNDGQSYGNGNEEGVVQSGMLQYASNSMSFYNTPNLNTVSEQNKNTGPEDFNNRQMDESNLPVYGAKIGSRHKNRANDFNNSFNGTDFGSFSNGYEVVEPSQENNPTFGETHINYNQNQNTNNFVLNNEPQEIDEYSRPATSNVQNILNFPRVVDFTKFAQYPTELDTSRFVSHNVQKPSIVQTSITHSQSDNLFNPAFNSYSNKKNLDSSATLKDHYNMKNNEDNSDKSISKPFFDQDTTYNHVISHNKHHNKNTESKKNMKHKPWASGNYSMDFKDWKDASTLNGYGYSTNYSNMNFKFGVSEPKKPFSHDEIIPASSNVVDLTNYHPYPETDYDKFKKIPEFNYDDEFSNSISVFKDKFKSHSYLNQLKDSFSTVPTTTSYWGSAYKDNDYSSFKDHPKKTHYSVINHDHDEVVSIPRRPSKLYTKPTETKQIDWPTSHHRPHKLNKPNIDWTKDVLDTRYKSEEDLLGLRTHDTSHPAYLPTFKPSNSVRDNDIEFKKLVEKWRQSYMRSKYKDVPARDYDSYGSDVKPTHVPVPKPYPIEVPHPVIVPVPRPFPVRVPVSRPVAVPVIREITVPIEKPVPYPVYKNVPYPVEKLVPVRVDKEVSVPVEKPYPVHIPYVRPVFHHTRPHDDRDLDHIDDDDFRRPESKKPSQYKKRPYGTRYRSRRPSRSSYQDRNRRRWPERKRPAPQNSEHRHHSRPLEFHSPPYKHRDYEPDADDDDNSDYAQYCRRTGNC